MQPQFKLERKGGSVLPSCHVKKIEQIREISKHYHMSNIYNIYESGLSYRMGPQRTNLSSSDQRDTVHGTEFGKHKELLTIFLHTIQMDLMCYQYPRSVKPIKLTIPDGTVSVFKKSLLVPKEQLGGFQRMRS